MNGYQKPSLKHRDCPFCKRPVQMLAQSCEHCKGDLSAGELQGLDWRKQPALESQIRFLKLMKQEIPSDVGRGVAADLIGQVREDNPQLFQQACERDKNKPTSPAKAIIAVIVVLILLVAVLFALRRAGMI